jgi:hypothetical protein
MTWSERFPWGRYRRTRMFARPLARVRLAPWVARCATTPSHRAFHATALSHQAFSWADSRASGRRRRRRWRGKTATRTWMGMERRFGTGMCHSGAVGWDPCRVRSLVCLSGRVLFLGRVERCRLARMLRCGSLMRMEDPVQTSKVVELLRY